MASAIPGTSRSQTLRVASGVTSRGERPVPPQVITTSARSSSAAVGFEMLVRPALRKMMGMSELERPVQRARLATAQKKKQPRRYYLRGRIDRLPDGTLMATPASNQNSALLGTLARANCLIVIPTEASVLQAGAEVACVRIDLPEGSVL